MRLISRLLRLEVLNKAEGKCEKCGKRLFQKRKAAAIQKYDKVTRENKVTREIAHTWRRDGDQHNINLDNLGLVCDDCHNELLTTH